MDVSQGKKGILSRAGRYMRDGIAITDDLGARADAGGGDLTV